MLKDLVRRASRTGLASLQFVGEIEHAGARRRLAGAGSIEHFARAS